MKLPRYYTVLYNIKAQLGLGNGLGLSSYSTAASTATRESKWKGSMHTLFRRISPMGNPNVSIVPLLNQWVEEGHPVDKQQLFDFSADSLTLLRYQLKGPFFEIIFLKIVLEITN